MECTCDSLTLFRSGCKCGYQLAIDYGCGPLKLKQLGKLKNGSGCKTISKEDLYKAFKTHYSNSPDYILEPLRDKIWEIL